MGRVNVPLHRVAVVGAGAVGSFFGAVLAQAGHPVTLIARAPHVDAIKRSGLRLERADRVEIVPIAASVDLAAVRGADLVLFCVKSTDTEAVARRWPRTSAPEALVLSLQNGVENAATIARRVRQPRRAGGGLCRHGDAGAGRGEALRPRRPRDRREARRRRRRSRAGGAAQDIVDLFATAGVPVKISPDVMAELWSS